MGDLPFSQRMGFVPARVEFQLNSMDDNLRNGIWNVIYNQLINPLNYKEIGQDKTQFYYFQMHCWLFFFKKPVDAFPLLTAKQDFREKFFKMDFHKVYDFIEFILTININGFNSLDFCKSLNIVFKAEMAGYSILNGKIIPVTNEIELHEIDTAQLNANRYGLDGVRLHLKEAINMLSAKKNPDYRNSIKESISAVESICKVLANDSKAELGKAIDKLSGTIPIHGALKQGLKSIYGYTSDESGIRHALMDSPNVEREDAVFMLVSCSAFTNYLIAKAIKAGHNFNEKKSP